MLNTAKDAPSNELTQSTIGSSVATSAGGVQMTLSTAGSLLHPSAESQMTMAIADLIHSRALPFTLTEDPKFRKMLMLAKNVPASYKPPSRKAVAQELLDLNYDAYIRKNMDLLERDAEIYGVSFFGDGATVRKTPLLNILASGVYIPTACLEIVDCSTHLAEGGKKDAEYIYDLFLHFIKDFEGRKPNAVDLVLFDGALNVQKAGELLASSYPRIAVLHGAEHVMSLFFNDVFKNRELQTFIKISRIFYKVFGSGAMHIPYAAFQKHSKNHNNGRKIGLIRASDTRMGGHVISLMRLLRLHAAIKNTVVSVEMCGHKVCIYYVLSIEMC